MFQEPQPTPFDLRFNLFGFAVRIHPGFWLLAVLLNLRTDAMLPEYVSWVTALFLAILIHELGHALAMRRFGIDSDIVLYWLGGLTIPRSIGRAADMRSTAQIVISAAGPMMGFAAAYVIAAIVVLAVGTNVLFFYGPLSITPWIEGLERAPLQRLINQFWFVSVFWGLINLLPVYPLDGGQIAREVFLRISPARGIEMSLRLSIVVAAGLSAYAAVAWRSVFVALLFGLLAYQSFQILEAYRRGGRW